VDLCVQSFARKKIGRVSRIKVVVHHDVSFFHAHWTKSVLSSPVRTESMCCTYNQLEDSFLRGYQQT